MMKPLVPITALLERRRRDGDRVAFEITDDWAQGRTTFGGLIAALAVAAMRDVTGSDWPLRALQASFIGPVLRDLVVQVHLLRQGRHVRQVQATLSTQGSPRPHPHDPLRTSTVSDLTALKQTVTTASSSRL